MMLHFQINPHSGVPVYRQMVDQVKYYIASEALKPGDQLPSIRELAQKLAVNPTTVVRVYSDLEHEGVIEMRHGKGAFVAVSSRRMSAAERERSLRELARHLAVEAVQMGASASQVLNLVREELVELRGTEEEDPPMRLSVVPKR
jgi:GntR family transcriptional regulator